MKKLLAKVVAVIITVVLVVILLSQISISDIAKTLTSIDPIYLIIGFILYLFSYFFRALRFHILLNNKVSIKHLFSIVCVHNMANMIMPARTGEVSYVYLSKKLHNISAGEGIASLMVARIFDFTTISLFFFVSIISIESLPEIIGKAVWVIVSGVVITILILFLVLYFGEKCINTIRTITVMLNVEHFNATQYLLRKGDETAQSFETIKSKRVVVWTIAVSIGIWLVMYLAYYFLIYAFGIDLTIFEIIIIASFTTILLLLPFCGFGGFGTVEATIAGVMILFGVLKELAIVAAFGLHIIGLIYVMAFGVYGTWKLNLKTKIFRRA